MDMHKTLTSRVFLLWNDGNALGFAKHLVAAQPPNFGGGGATRQHAGVGVFSRLAPPLYA